MSEEQYNHIDQSFRDAAERLEHPFDESSWQRMEKLLDQEDDRRRPFLLWWVSAGIILLLTVGLYGIFSVKSRSDQNMQVKQVASSIQSRSSAPAETGLKPSTNKTSLLSSGQSVPPVTTGIHDSSYGKTDISADRVAHKQPFSPRVNTEALTAGPNYRKAHDNHWIALDKGRAQKRANRKTGKDRLFVSVDNPGAADREQDNVIRTAKATSVQIDTSARETLSAVAQNIDPFRQSVMDSSGLPGMKSNETKAGDQKEKTPPAFSHLPVTGKRSLLKKGFYFIAGLGADISSTKFLSARKSPLTARIGAGIGFRINRRWSVQSGFYATPKKYVAGPGDYKVSADPYWNQVTLLSVDANCLVYEIPIQVRYDFTQGKKWLLFSTAGLSSFIMKKETYNYHILSNTYYYQHEYSYTGNRHPFSVAGLSVGLQRNLNSRFAVMMEPYVQVPLGGVGEGRIRLYSFGIQSGLIFQPGNKKGAGKK